MVLVTDLTWLLIDLVLVDGIGSYLVVDRSGSCLDLTWLLIDVPLAWSLMELDLTWLLIDMLPTWLLIGADLTYT